MVIAKVHHAWEGEGYFEGENTVTLENGAVDMMASATAAIVMAFLSVSLF